jgi:hypothetical protein
MRKEQRPSEARAKRQIDIVIAAAVDECAALRETIMVDRWIDWVTGRGGGEYIRDEAFAPAADVVIEAEAIVGTPMPGQDMAAALRVPVPFGIEPQPGNPIAKAFLHGLVRIEILAGA